MCYEYGVIANHKSGDKAFRKGAKCYITWSNPGNAGDRVRIHVISRRGRYINKIVNTKHLTNFRAAWIPEHIREHFGEGWAYFKSKNEAQKKADFFSKEYGS